MSLINREDLIIIFMFGLHLAKIDKNFHKLEKRLLKSYQDQLKLTEEEAKELFTDRKSLEESSERLSSNRAKLLLIKTVCAVSHSDGVEHELEVEFINRINFRLGEVLELPPWEEWGKYENEVQEILRTYIYIENKEG